METASLDNTYITDSQSLVKWLADGSGLVIYNGYSNETTFVRSSKPVSEDVRALPFPNVVSPVDFINWLSIDEMSANQVIDRLLVGKFLRKQS